MNMEPTMFSGEAKVSYRDADFLIMTLGAYVTCAVTGERIPIEQLKYWSAERQEAYKDAAASLKRWQETHA